MFHRTWKYVFIVRFCVEFCHVHWSYDTRVVFVEIKKQIFIANTRAIIQRNINLY